VSGSQRGISLTAAIPVFYTGAARLKYVEIKLLKAISISGRGGL
jgi:hypothetical protein